MTQAPGPTLKELQALLDDLLTLQTMRGIVETAIRRRSSSTLRETPAIEPSRSKDELDP